jgi:hypothetical protein
MATRKPATKKRPPVAMPADVESAALPAAADVGAPTDDPPTSATPFLIPHGPGPIMLGVDASTGEATIDVPDGMEAHWYLVGRRADGAANVGPTWLAPESVRGLTAYVELVPVGAGA